MSITPAANISVCLALNKNEKRFCLSLSCLEWVGVRRLVCRVHYTDARRCGFYVRFDWQRIAMIIPNNKQIKFILKFEKVALKLGELLLFEGYLLISVLVLTKR